MTDETLRVCGKCGQPKLLSEFYKKGDGWQSKCKACFREATEAYRKKNLAKYADIARANYSYNREELARRQRDRRAADPGRAREISRKADAKRKGKRKEYRQANAGRIREQAAQYREGNAAKIDAYNAAYRAANRELLRERHRQWRKTHKKADAAIHARWRKANKAAVNAQTHKRRVLLAGTGGENYTAAQWEELKAAQDFTCLLCGRREPEIALTVDHVVPVSKGGTNDITNVQGLCRPCNSAKHTSTLDLRNKDGGSDGNGSGTGSA